MEIIKPDIGSLPKLSSEASIKANSILVLNDKNLAILVHEFLSMLVPELEKLSKIDIQSISLVNKNSMDTELIANTDLGSLSEALDNGDAMIRKINKRLDELVQKVP